MASDRLEIVFGGTISLSLRHCHDIQKVGLSFCMASMCPVSKSRAVHTALPATQRHTDTYDNSLSGKACPDAACFDAGLSAVRRRQGETDFMVSWFVGWLTYALQATWGHAATSELFESINSVIICSLKVSISICLGWPQLYTCDATAKKMLPQLLVSRRGQPCMTQPLSLSI